MELLTKSGSIAECLNALSPTHIAVAYVGLGWEKYVAKESLRSIVLSPTFGSNAIAIRQLIAHLGIDNVHFLDRLHAKIYLSRAKALIGSSNLSDNGLQGEGGLTEAGVLVSGQAELRQLKSFYERIVVDAKKSYDTPRKKYKKLNDLEILNQKSSLGRLLKLKETHWKGVHINQFDVSEKRRIHICPYEPDLTIIKSKIQQAIPGRTQATYKSMYEDIMGFLPKDDVRVGDWLLCIESDLKAMHAKPKGDISWMYVDHVVPGASSTTPYTTVAIQERARKAWETPFLLDAGVQKAIRSIAPEQQFAPLYDNKAKKAGLKVADTLTMPFIRAIQKFYKA